MVIHCGQGIIQIKPQIRLGSENEARDARGGTSEIYWGNKPTLMPGRISIAAAEEGWHEFDYGAVVLGKILVISGAALMLNILVSFFSHHIVGFSPSFLSVERPDTSV